MNRIIRASLGVGCLLLASANAQGANPKWNDTNDCFATSGVYSDDYGTYITALIEGNENRIYMAYNFDLILPAGLTFPLDDPDAITDNNEDGLYPASKKGVIYHSLSFAIKDNGARARVACLNFENMNFLKPTGNVADCYIEIHPLAKPGVNQVLFREMALNSKDEAGNSIMWYQGDTPFNAAWSTIDVPAERTMSVNIDKWGTLILPFELSALPEDVTAYSATSVNSNHEVELEPVTKLEPYKPYIINAPKGWIATLTGTASEEHFPSSAARSRSTIDVPAHEAVYPVDAIVQNGVLHANIKAHERTEGYLLTVDGETPSFTQVTADSPAALTPGDAFIALDDYTDRPATLAIKASDTSSIALINGESTLSPLYNLQGLRIATPRPGQIYISNGHLIRQ